ncbi:MAG: polysaccharide biosynthesis/export family protein [Gammaproteobacteria bacterium]|nr:polysaccharide biosynthesis/export family protein [Gammaproteobacteria bacterium]
MRRIKYFVVVSCLLFLVGCSAPGVYITPSNIQSPILVKGKLVKPKIVALDAKVLSTQRPYQYRIGPYDILNIIVWEHVEFNAGGTTVDSHGYIFFPYVGRCKVSGLTVEQIRRKLTRRMTAYIRTPQITVVVNKFNSKQVSVIGEVINPGTQGLSAKPLTLLGAINNAGGVNRSSADTGRIYVFRSGKHGLYIYLMSAHTPSKLLIMECFILRNNDIVYVASSARGLAQVMPTAQTIWHNNSVVR